MSVPASESSLLLQATAILGASVVAVSLFKKLGLGSVMGYLVAGVILGPYALGIIQSAQDVMHISELGVVLLLFIIGLELNPKRLWQLRRPIMGSGALQVGLSTGAFMSIGLIAGWNLSSALVMGMAFSLSSTAIGLQLLDERQLRKGALGEISFSVLLFQDMAVIPMIAILGGLVKNSAPGSSSGANINVIKGVLAVLFIVALGRYLIRPIFRFIASTKSRELFTAFALFLVLGVAALMQMVGLSMAFGSFLAGVLLADSEYRHELEIDIEPFKGLLLGLFFSSVGMSINFLTLLDQPRTVFLILVALLTVKFFILYIVGRSSQLPQQASISFGLVLSQASEFGFVLFASGRAGGILSANQADLLSISAALSMLCTPLLMMGWDRLALRWFADTDPTAKPENDEFGEVPVIVAGYGRVGQLIGRILHATGIPATVIDHDPNQVELLRKFGWKTFYGDVTRLELLKAAGADKAKVFVLAVDEGEAALKTHDLIREHFPHLKVLARVRNRTWAYQFMARGVPIFRETFDTSLLMAEEVLKAMGYGAFEAKQSAQRFKAYDTKMLAKSAAFQHDQKSLINLGLQNRQELEKLLASDEKKPRAPSHDGW